MRSDQEPYVNSTMIDRVGTSTASLDVFSATAVSVVVAMTAYHNPSHVNMTSDESNALIKSQILSCCRSLEIEKSNMFVGIQCMRRVDCVFFS